MITHRVRRTENGGLYVEHIATKKVSLEAAIKAVSQYYPAVGLFWILKSQSIGPGWFDKKGRMLFATSEWEEST